MLVESHISDVDADNALLVLAIIFMRHGRTPFRQALAKGIAKEHNLNMPKRLDKFYSGAKRGDPKQFVVRNQAEGWKITVSGATWLGETYGVKMGRTAVPVGKPE